MRKAKPTRGYGLLEGYLARQRSEMANRLISCVHMRNRILDIGCGTHPLLLLHSDFPEKYGLDKVTQDSHIRRFHDYDITLINYDIELEDTMPFDSEYFDVVTMLAVIEHIEPKRLVKVLSEINRILRPGGMYVVTTPAVWTAGLLRFMARLRLVSPVEIEEHKAAYSHFRISSILQEANFSLVNLQFGYFEMLINTWAAVKK